MKLDQKLTIAIDGWSSCGKSTMAKALAKVLAYTYVDSGAMYRAITLYCLNNELNDEDQIDEVTLKQRIPEIKVEFIHNEKKRSGRHLS